MKAINMDTS
jgi:hypothetical protein